MLSWATGGMMTCTTWRECSRVPTRSTNASLICTRSRKHTNLASTLDSKTKCKLQLPLSGNRAWGKAWLSSKPFSKTIFQNLRSLNVHKLSWPRWERNSPSKIAILVNPTATPLSTLAVTGALQKAKRTADLTRWSQTKLLFSLRVSQRVKIRPKSTLDLKPKRLKWMISLSKKGTVFYQILYV